MIPEICYLVELVKRLNYLFTLAKILRRSSSDGLPQNDARSVNIFLEGGVVISKNIVKSVLIEHAGSLSCDSHDLITPFCVCFSLRISNCIISSGFSIPVNLFKTPSTISLLLAGTIPT